MSQHMLYGINGRWAGKGGVGRGKVGLLAKKGDSLTTTGGILSSLEM